MIIRYFHNLSAEQRSVRADRHLGYTLAFVAGAVNAGGFLAIGQYTSHMTGIVSTMADQMALGQFKLARPRSLPGLPLYSVRQQRQF